MSSLGPCVEVLVVGSVELIESGEVKLHRQRSPSIVLTKWRYLPIKDVLARVRVDHVEQDRETHAMSGVDPYLELGAKKDVTW
jgi:hypothetical protein